jgi:hypothetical protein
MECKKCFCNGAKQQWHHFFMPNRPVAPAIAAQVAIKTVANIATFLRTSPLTRAVPGPAFEGPVERTGL